MASAPIPTLSVVYPNRVCNQCGCVCDDIVLTVEAGNITKADNACDKGRAWFLANHSDPVDGALSWVKGQPVSLKAAIDTAAEILVQARYPLIFGLADLPCEAQRQAVGLADRVGACLDTTLSDEHGAFDTAFQEVGEVTCSLGEVKNRADLVIFWGTDPVTSHPRHGERFSLDAKGLFTPRGRADRFVVVVDVLETATAKQADVFLKIQKGCDFEALWALRAMVRGIPLRESIQKQTGIEDTALAGLSERMKSCRFGILFFGPGLCATRGRHKNAEAALRLVKDLNDYTRFYAKPMSGPGNVSGAENVVCWQTGYPPGVHFGQGFPRFNSGEFSAKEILGRGEADAAMMVAIDPNAPFSDAIKKRLAALPTVLLTSDAENLLTPGVGFRPTVSILTAPYTISGGGTVFRMDDTPLPLRPVCSSTRPIAKDVLAMIEKRIEELQTQKQVAMQNEKGPR